MPASRGSQSFGGRGRALALVAVIAAIAVAVSTARLMRTRGPDRTEALVRALAERGLIVDPQGVWWLERPPLGLRQATVGRVPVALRASASAQEPNDIYLAMARLSPDGVLLDTGAIYNLTETSAVDEQPPVGQDSWLAFVEQPLLEGEQPSRLRLVDLGGSADPVEQDWTSFQRMQAAVTRLQQTGLLEGLHMVSYAIEPPPAKLALSVDGGALVVTADDRRAVVSIERPLEVPAWLGVEPVPERLPGSLVTWAVDRVRAEIGDEAMQYIKAIAFSALDVLLSGKEELTGDTAAEDIAADLGESSLEAPSRTIPVDPDIGFPPPPLEPYVTPALPGEGQWNSKEDEAFVRLLPALPPTFVTTFIRGDRGRKTTRVYVVLWDPRLVQLNMMAGVSEPKSATGATGPGFIPREPAVMRRLAGAMNAGFQALHGEFGMMSDGIIYLPAKPYGATVAVMRDGSTTFGTWPNAAVIPEDMMSYRQNMTPIVVDQAFNPYKRTWWGGTPSDWEDKTHTVRTGICLTKEGFAGYFYGADLSPEALANAMIQTRCAYGIALDMNAGHSGFEYYKVAPAADMEPLGRPLRRSLEREGEVRDMEGWSFRARRMVAGMGLMYFPRYIQREGRDFFYLTVRDVLPGAPIALGKGAAAWRVKGLPQHGFPYALALSEVELGGARARVLKLDPRMLTADPASAAPAEGAPALVALVQPAAPSAPDQPSLWWSPGAFALGPEPLVDGSVRIASGAASARGRAPAALGVELEGGMLVYVEVEAEGGAAATELAALLESLGCAEPLLLEAPLAIALGGDTDLSGRAVRLDRAPLEVRMLRHAGPGAHRIFTDTPVVPLETWFPLQARRIRYFKKTEDTDS